MTGFSIAGRAIGPNQPPYIVAEMSANHMGDIDRAKAIMSMAAEAGADAVKLQTYTADTITLDHDGPEFQITSGPWAGQSLHALYRSAQTPFEWHEDLFEHARQVGIPVFSAPFDLTAVDLLESLNTPAYKIASLELRDLPLVRRVAQTKKPLILSSGTANLDDISAAVDAARAAGAEDIAVLHCVSGYPAPIEETDLRTMPDIAERFDVVTGLSDHSLGLAAPISATALGASIIEKHVTLARADGGPDGAFSLEPAELKLLVDETRRAHACLGEVSYDLRPSEAGNAQFRRSLYVVKDIPAGGNFTMENVRSIRPGFGLHPDKIIDVVGRKAAMSISRGTALREELIA